YLAPLGRETEALEQNALGLREDPLNLILRLFPCEVLLAAEDPAGEAEALKLLEMYEDFWIPRAWLAAYQALRGRLNEARVHAERVREVAPGNLGVLGILAAILSLLGDEERAASLLAEAGPSET